MASLHGRDISEKCRQKGKIMKRIRINASQPYDVLIGGGLLERCGEEIKPLVKGSKTVIVTDDNVGPLYAQTVKNSLEKNGFTAELYTFRHGEESKCAQTLLDLYDFLGKNNITRSDFLVALGGGVVGDLTGFAAATYLRGIDYIQLPTSLLAQVDSSVGGKTAIDIAAGKNLVGAFKQPKLVIADVDALSTLSDDFFADGMGEVIKYGMIYSKPLFDRLKDGNVRSAPEDVIAQCVDIKREVVEADEFDTGLRMILNFGHTLGHSIEKHFNYTGFSHGRAVAAGMYLITKAAEKNGLVDGNVSEELKSCLIANGLPYEADIDGEALFSGAVNDKKRFSDTINIILCRQIGRAEIVKLGIEDFRKMIEG